jgi:hypothetical protein
MYLVEGQESNHCETVAMPHGWAKALLVVGSGDPMLFKRA